jgi:dTDP-4-dehydrorhamnose 3,5-epimerase
MNYQYIDLVNQKDLIDGVVLRKLILHKDPTGSLVETLRSDWSDVFDKNDLSFAMQYFSVTPSGIARDEDQWHVHKYQTDRFICISGRIVTAIYDPRKNSKTFGKLNLFVMGPDNENEMYLLVIPKETLHSFMVISKSPAYLLNFPTKLYNPQDEGRVSNEHFQWSKVRGDFSH